MWLRIIVVLLCFVTAFGAAEAEAASGVDAGQRLSASAQNAPSWKSNLHLVGDAPSPRYRLVKRDMADEDDFGARFFAVSTVQLDPRLEDGMLLVRLASCFLPFGAIWAPALVVGGDIDAGYWVDAILAYLVYSAGLAVSSIAAYVIGLMVFLVPTSAALPITLSLTAISLVAYVVFQVCVPIQTVNAAQRHLTDRPRRKRRSRRERRDTNDGWESSAYRGRIAY